MSTHRNPRDRAKVQKWAQSLFAMPNFYVLDTETTGLGKGDEIVQIGIIDKSGEVVLDALVRPTQRLSREVIAVHGITNEMLLTAPTLDDLYVTLSVKLAGAHLVAYNMDFDWRMMTQSLALYKLPLFRTASRHCAMKQYASYHGSWNSQRNSYNWHNLGKAATHEKIEVVDAHTALGDVKMTLQLIKRMAGD
jgi:DNA polymerase III subunit epsilon